MTPDDIPALSEALASSRAALDAVDAALVELLAKRRALVSAVWERKRAAGEPLRDPERERAILARAARSASVSGLEPSAVRAVMRAVLDAMRASDPRKDSGDGSR